MLQWRYNTCSQNNSSFWPFCALLDCAATLYILVEGVFSHDVVMRIWISAPPLLSLLFSSCGST